MDKKILQAASEKIKKHKAHMIWVLCLCLLAGLVGTGTYRSLTVSAEALAKDPICGLEEHTHDASCYTLGERPLVCGIEESEGHFHNETCFDEEGNLICGQEEHEGHFHGDECYGEAEPVLICERPEHVHTDECYPVEEVQPEETVPEETVTEEQEPSAQPETTPEPEETVKPEETADPEEKTKEEAEALEEVVEKEEKEKEDKEVRPLEFEEKSGNVTVRVSFEDDKAFDEEDMPVTMKVEPIKEGSPEYEAYYNQIIDETKINTAEKMFLFDITFVNKDGDEIEPLKTASVSFTSEDIPMPEKEAMDKEEELLNVVHIPEKGEAEILDAEIKTAEERHDEEKPDIAFETESFSIYGVVYTVDYFVEMDGRTYSWSMVGGTSVSVTDVLINLGAFTEDKAEAFVKDVKDVEFSRPEVLTIENENDVWMIKSLAPFATTETLTFTLKNGEVFVIEVTDASVLSDELKNFLTSLSISGATIGPDGNYVVVPNQNYEITMNFKETADYQFDDHATLTYKIPDGITLPEGISTTINISITSGGSTYVIPAQVNVSAGGDLTVKFDENDPNFHKLEASSNVSFRVAVGASFTKSITHTEWSQFIEKDIIIDETDYSDVFVKKFGEYNEGTGVFSYTVTISATGDVQNVNVRDVITGDAVVFNNDVSISGNSSTPVNNSAANGFDYTFPSMRKNEVITITYTGTVDVSKADDKGVITVDQTGNTATVKKNDDPPKEAKYGREIKLRTLVKNKAVDQGDEIIDGKNYKIHEWEVVYNSLAMLSAAGNTITDSISADSQQYMSYYGDVTLQVYNHSGTLVDTRTFTPGSGSSWAYIVPKEDKDPYKYVFKYKTKTDLEEVNRSAKNLNLKNEVGSGDMHTSAGVDVNASETPSITKDVVSSSTEEITWHSRVHVPEIGLSSAVVTDTLPVMWSPNIGIEGPGRSLFDVFKDGSLVITGLLSGESYSTSVTEDKVVITFFKDSGKTQPGLQKHTGGHNIDITLTTRVNQEWLEAGYNYPTTYQSEHINKIEIAGSTAEARVRLLKPGLDKRGAESNGAYKYTIYVSDVTQSPIIINDTFNKSILELDTSKESADWNFECLYITGGDYVGHVYPSETGSKKVNYFETADGIQIIANNVPMQANGEFYPVYMITYFLKLKPGVNLDELAIHNGGTFSFTNTARWGDHESSYTFEKKHSFLNKELIEKATETNRKVKYRITFNAEKAELNGGEPMVMTDRLNANLSLDYTSVSITTQPEGIAVPYTISGDTSADNLNGTVATYMIPDSTFVTIEYYAMVVGSGPVDYKNTVVVHGETKEVTEHVNINIEGEGDGATAYLKIAKVDYFDANLKLPGVKFKLFSEKGADGKRENLAFPDEPPVYEKTVVTDENGTLLIDGSETWINFGRKYYLQETDPLPGYENLSFNYEFTLTDDIDKVDYPEHIYFFNDSFQIKNKPLQGLVVGKKVDSADEDDLSREYHFRVTLFQKDEDGKLVKDDDGNPVVDTSVNEIYGGMDFNEGVCELTVKNNEQISAHSMPKNIYFRVEELDGEGFIVSHTVGDVTLPGSSYDGVTIGEYTLVTFNNKKNITSVNASKNWLDKNGQAARPENAEVTFTLLANGTATDHKVVLNGVDETAGGATPQASDYEGADWTAYFTNLPRYDEQNVEIVYTIRETGTWDGYKIVGNDTVSSGGVITNKEISVSLDILKVAKGDENIKLARATFKLDQINSEASEESVISGTTKTVTTDENGSASFTDLSEGYYRIEETDTPDGYLIVGESTFYIKVTADGVRLLTKGTGKPSTWADDATSYGNVIRFTAASEDSNARAVVENTPGAELPHTGGSGTMIYTVIGTILIAAAGILLLRRKRNEMMN